MKVLHVAPSLSPKLGGPTEVIINTVRELNKLGIQAEVATVSHDEETSERASHEEVSEYCGIPIRFFLKDGFERNQFIVSSGLSSFLRSSVNKYDLLDLHYLFTFSTLKASRIAWKHSVPYLVRAMGQLAPWSLRHRWYLKIPFYYFFEKKTLTEASSILCTTLNEQNDVLKLNLKSKTSIVPLGATEIPKVEDSKQRFRKRASVPIDSRIILFLGRLHPKKRPELLIKAMKSVIRDITGAYLVFAGEGDADFESLLRSIARECGIENQVKFIGFVEGVERATAFWGSDVFVLPSHSENFGVAVVEAMSCQLPIVVTPEVQISDVIKVERAGLVAEGSEEAFSRAIIDVLRGGDEITSMVSRARTVVETRFRWPCVAKDQLKVYQEILDQKFAGQENPHCGFVR